MRLTNLMTGGATICYSPMEPAAAPGSPSGDAASAGDAAAAAEAGEGEAAAEAAPGGAAADGDGGADGAAAAAEPTAEEAAAATAAADLETARAVKPETAEGYKFEAPEAVKAALGDLSNDPVLKHLQATAHAKGWTQGQFNDVVVQGLEMLADGGFLMPALDAAAETAKLGEGGAALQQEQSTFLDGLKARGEIAADMHQQLMSLVPTAAGTKALAAFRKMMVPGGAPVAAAGEAASGGEAGDSPEQAEARSMRRDPRYDTDRDFRKDADRKWQAAFTKA